MGVLEFLGKNKVSPELRGGNGNSLIFVARNGYKEIKTTLRFRPRQLLFF
jgi:hypothetical protein